MKPDNRKQHQAALQVIKDNWRAEKEGARVYRELGEAERDEKRKGILLRLAEAEENHAHRWEQRLQDLGGACPPLSDSWNKRLSRWINRQLGTDLAIKRLEAAEEKDKNKYQEQLTSLAHDEKAPGILREIAVEEKVHATVLQKLPTTMGPQTALD